MALGLGPEVMLEQLGLLRSRPDSRADLARWRGPLTLLVGEDDTVTPPALAEEMAGLAPQAELQHHSARWTTICRSTRRKRWPTP